MILSLQRIQHTNSIGIIGNTKTGTGERKGRQAMYIELKNINKSFGDFQASKDVNFAIEKGKLVGLLGPSGSGKTTILRMLAGLEHQDSGDICINGNVVNDLPSSQRGIGFVFQNYALFPYLTVYDNIAYGLKIQKKDKKFIKQRVTELLDLVGLPGLEKRYPDQLSGGQRQRIALARALAPNPEVLLLDEPFAAIDAKVRQELRTWLRETIDKIGITSIFVTHDQEEALTMSDKIVVMKNGEIQQIGSPQDIYNEPANRFVANFIGESNILSGTMIDDYKVMFDDIVFDCVDYGFKKNEKVDVVIRPEDIDIVDVKDGKMTGEVLSVLFKGVHYEIMVETVPGTSVTVNMRVIRNHEVTSEDGKEKISANNFYVDVDDVEEMDDKEIIAFSNAQAWEVETDDYISIAKVEYELEKEEGLRWDSILEEVSG